MPVENTTMRFSQLDRILEIRPGSSIVAERTVRHNEDFLKDHFPLFAVLPGVLMLEALYQASTWLVRETEEHRIGLLYLAEARNVKFADFVAPGETLKIHCELTKRDGKRFQLKCQGTKGDSVAVSARLVVAAGEVHAKGDPNGRHADYVAAVKRQQLLHMFNVGK